MLYGPVIIIIIGSTALRGPWPSSEAFCFYRFRDNFFSRLGSSAPRPTLGYPGGQVFSVRVVSLSRLVQDLAFCPCMT
jgi:hypothetical protein